MSFTPLGPLRASIQRLPLFLSPIASGFPSPAEGHIEATLSLDELCIRHPAATHLLRAADDSMQGAGIFVGDVLMVDRSIELHAGIIVVVTDDPCVATPPVTAERLMGVMMRSMRDGDGEPCDLQGCR